MHWFNGEIPEAIMSSKQRNIPFIVYIEGSDESSNQMDSVWNDLKVSKLFSSENCVAVKLNNESEQCKQFSQLYPVVCVPSIFFIGSAGMPLEVIGGAVSVDELIAKGNKAFEMFRGEKQSSAASTSQPEPTQAQTSSASEPQEATAVSSVEERVERAKRLIEEKRKQKAEQEKKEKLEKETKRREEGQQLSIAKKELEERRQQELVNQIREDRAKEKAAREAIRQKIAQDKLEREARRKDEIQAKLSAQQPSTSQTTTTTTATNRTNSNTTRLQFRLPDGSSIIETFQSDALLEAVRQFVESETSHKTITLTTVYPRRQLTDADMLQTLSSLGLAPNSTLIVSPVTSTTISKSSSSGSFIMTILAPFFALFNFIKVFLFGGSDHPRGSYGGDNLPGGREHVHFSDSKTMSTNNDLRRRNTNNRTSNAEGNIHRLRNQDDDDDNNTWNGNSTQQM